MSNDAGRRISLDWLLPAAISAMLLGVLVALSWWAHAELSRSLVSATHERLHSLSAQFVQGLQATSSRYQRDVQDRAQLPEIHAFLSEPSPGNRQAALAAISAVDRSATISATEILDARGVPTLVTGLESARVRGAARRLIDRASSSGSAAVGAFLALDDSTVVTPAIAPVIADGMRVGYVVEWRIVSRNVAQRELLSLLLGSGGRLLLGSMNGVWTDQVAVESAVPPEVPQGRVATYERADGVRMIGLMTAVPESPWHMLIEFDEADVLAPAGRFRSRILRAAALLILISFAGARLISRRVTRPLQDLTLVSEAISAGDYSRRAMVAGVDEMTRLGSAFNQMAERVQDAHVALENKVEELRATREQFVRAQRMEAVGQLAGGVAHDFNNLLTVILAESEFAKEETDPDTRRASIAEIARAGERAAALTRQLLAFSRRQLFAPTVFNLPELVHELDRMLTRLIGENIRLTITDSAVSPNIRADKAQIEQVLVNLVVNARDAMPDGGTISIDIRNETVTTADRPDREDPRPGEYVLISVSDTGSGIHENVIGQIFEPFYTTKEPGKGTGLGLATSYGIVKQSSGHIVADSDPLIGTTMRVYLPSVHDTATPVQRSTVDGVAGTETILLVEDEHAVRHVGGRILRREGYEVLEAASGEAAIEIVTAHPGQIHLLLTDVVLPGIGGREVAERTVALRPGIKVLFASGYANDVILQHDLITRNATLLEKPFTMQGLAQAVRAALDHDDVRMTPR